MVIAVDDDDLEWGVPFTVAGNLPQSYQLYGNQCQSLINLQFLKKWQDSLA